jgi:predicted nucleic acid-binding protein
VRDTARRPAIFSALRITIDPETDSHAWSESVSLADRFGLTLYDACYLKLALRRALPLATLDGDLRSAAGECGVTLFGA